jgi:hypothetical protein
VLGFLLLGWGGLRGAAPSVRLEFAAPEASARTFQPLRLLIDLPGPPRSVVVRLVLPPGARTVRPIDRIDVGGGRPRTYLFNVYVPEGLPAGPFVVTGEVRDDSRVWPLHATLRIRADPKFRVGGTPATAIMVASDETATDKLTLLNTGNLPLSVTFKLQPNADLRAAIAPTTLALAPGAGGSVAITARPENPVSTLLETSLFASVEARSDDFVQRETVGFDFAFVPVNADPGPLFAQLEGEIVPGGLVADNSDGELGFAGRFSLSGNLTARTSLEMSGADGRTSSAGSRVGLADRDFARVALRGDWGEAAGGLVTPPMFGVLEPSTQGRGGLADLAAGEWRLAAFGTRDTYPGFARENYGLQARQPEGPWELGVLAQRNEATGTPESKRLGGYAQYRWIAGKLDTRTQVAAADIDTDALGVRFAGEEQLTWRDEHLALDATIQLAQEGFDLAGRSSRESTGTLSWREEPWLWYIRGTGSKDDGALESEMQRRRDTGQVVLAPAVLEQTTRNTSERREWEVGVNRQTGLGLFALSALDSEYSTAMNPAADYLERSATVGWTRSIAANYAEVELTGGREHAESEDTDFAELELNFSGQWRNALTYSLTLRRDWNWNGFSTGLRRPGLYGQLAFTRQAHANGWRVEAGLNVYDYDQLESSTYVYAVVEMPVSQRLRLGVEINVETNGGPSNAWVFLRLPLKVPMKWRPVNGALTGHLSDARGAPLAGALADLDGRRAISTADGRFVLPAMPPGRYPLNWRLPDGWTEGPEWPREIELRAGEREFIGLRAQQLAVLVGTVVVHPGIPGVEARRPEGAVRASTADGRWFETTVTAGRFRLGLPPGRYRVHFEGAETDAVLGQLQGTVEIEPGSTEVVMELAATETRRKMRQTLFINKEP